ncbi:MAG: ribosome maturation factor RimM [Gammaproteobacteria bacterium]|nr:ribosome maturation factor RimM [Gammaproteobacteria bacterium]
MDNQASRQDSHQHAQASKKIVLGRITGVYGIKGWVKVFSYTDPMESIVDYDPWFIRPENRKTAPWVSVRLKAGKRHAKTVVAKLEHCNSRDEAEAFIGKEIAIEQQQLEVLQENKEYYWHDLIGLRVINQQAIELGVVKSLLETGANDVLVVVAEDESDKTADKEIKERLIPWAIPGADLPGPTMWVDLEQGVIKVDWDADF